MASGQDTSNGSKRGVAEKMARLRAHVHTAMVDMGLSMGQLATELGVGSPQLLADYLNGKQELPVWVVLRLADVTGRPVWWFFDEQPQGITLEAANVGLQNVSRIRLYLEAIESEFSRIANKQRDLPSSEFNSMEFDLEQPVRRMGEVVDLTPYLARARAILEREVSQEDSGEVSAESVEMVAHGLLSAETGAPPARRASSESFEKVRRLPVRGS